MKVNTIGFIGFGLIGGSIAKAIKHKYPETILISYNYSNKMNPDLKIGKKDQILDKVTSSLEDFSACNIIFLCAPVLLNIHYLPLLKNIINPDCIITDVGSVKSNIHKVVADNKLDENFIGGHPMTGSEKSGFQNANYMLFENAYYILTPTKKTPQTMTDTLTKLLKEIGAIPILLNHEEHDKIVAGISHLPHILASTLVNSVRENDNSKNLMKLLAAGGFRDITRIASSSPTMWENICLSNALYINEFILNYIHSLTEISNALVNQDKDFLYQIFYSAKEYRDALPEKGRGIFEKSYIIYLDIEDEAGAIATIANLLATKKISIKNIGIVHNREFEEGVLRIEFYDDATSFHAVSLLKSCGYTVHER